MTALRYVLLVAPSREISNPLTGERIVIRTSAADSGGALLAFDVFLPPGGHVPAQHAHPLQEERFTVLEGELQFRIGRQRRRVTSGETVTVPPKTPHWFGNRSTRPATAHVEVRPALRMEELLATSEQLGRSRANRVSQAALMLLEFRRELAVPFIPTSLVRLALAPFALWQRAHAHP